MKVNWPESTKAEVEKVLTPDYTSSDKSEYELCEDDGENYLARYQVKSLTWQRSRLTNAKSQLDKAYFKSLPKRTMGMLVPRRRGSLKSSKEIPEDEIAWAVRRLALSTVSNNSSNSSSLSFSPPKKTSTPISKH